MQIGEEEDIIEVVPAEQPLTTPALPDEEPVGVPD